MKQYRVTWWKDMTDNSTRTIANVPTFASALAILPHGPKDWERYRIEQGTRFVERGDQVGPRGAPAIERRRG
jgi:hypothetical protein